MLTHLHLEAAVLSLKNMPIYYFHRPQRAFSQPIGSLRNHDGDAEDNVDWKINLCFIYESRDTLKLFALFIASKAIAKLNPERNDQFEIKFKKLAVVAHVLQTTQDLVISRCCFAEDVKEMYQESKRTCTAIVLAIKSFVRGHSRCRCRRGFVNSLLFF